VVFGMTRIWLPQSRRRRFLAGGLAVAFLLAGFWGIRLWRLNGDVGRYAKYWSQPHGGTGGLVYVALGDSAAQGLGASSPELGYVGLVAARLRAATSRPVRVINLSRSGAHIRDVLATQVPRLAGLHPDLVTVDVGGNDITSYDRRQFERDAVALCSALPAGAVIADVPYFMHGKWERNAASGARFLQREAAAHGLRVARLHDALRNTGWSGMFTSYAADWFHPNDRGYRVWAQAFWKAIRHEEER